MEGQSDFIPTNDIATEIVNSSNSLESQFGKDWKKRSILNSINDVFTSSELDTINKKEKPVLNENSTDAEKFAVTANEVFTNNNLLYQASTFKDEKGNEQVYIEGNIGSDRFYVESPVFEIDILSKQDALISFSSERVGFITQDGKVFSIDKLFNHNDMEQDFVFQCASHRKTRQNVSISFKEGDVHDSGGIILALPENPVEIGTLAHEIGHAIRKYDFKEKPEQQKASSEAYQKFEETGNSRTLPLNNDISNGLNEYQVRKIKADEERGAWATGISLIREVGKEINFSASSTENIGNIIKRSEEALQTYDSVPYKLSAQDSKNNLVPTFSREMKKAARELRDKIKDSNIEYSDIPNFDDATGEAIGSNPKKIIEQVDRLDSKI